MKKITAFFLVLLPIFITVLMFVSGLIQNINFPVPVAGISISQHDADVKWDNTVEGKTEETLQLSAHVLPLNAKNQGIIWESKNKNIATVNDEGKVTLKDYGRVVIEAKSVENKSLVATCEIDSWDDKIHTITVDNSYNLSYMNVGSMNKPTLTTSPTIDHALDPTIKYSIQSSTSPQITVDEKTGVINAKEKGTAEVKIEATGADSEGKQSKAVQVVTVNVGEPIDVISWKNNGNEVITKADYDLFENFEVAPGHKKDTSKPDDAGVVATDFEYKCDDEAVADIDKNGKVTFKLAQPATFTVTYKRNPELKLTKTIESTCNNFKQVYFNRSSIELPYVKGSEITQDQLSWYTYPEDVPGAISNVEIESTDPNVVEVSGSGDQMKLYMKNPGRCALKISVNVGKDVKSDVCDVTILPYDTTKGETPVIQEAVECNDSAYYFLRNNIKCADSSIDPDTIRFELVDSTNDEATIDDNGILHFKNADTENPCVATIKPYVGQDTLIKTFTVSHKANAPVVSEVKDKIVLKVGQRFKFNNGTPVFESKDYEKYFDVLDDGSFIPKNGCDLNNFEFSDGKTIRLIVREDPVYVQTSVGPLYSTPYKWVDFINTFELKVFPETATKEDGSKYLPTYSYRFDSDTTGTIEDNTINFNKIGSCWVDVSYGNINDDKTLPEFVSSYVVRSTFNDQMGKFTVTDLSGSKVYQPYEKWNVTDSLYISNIAHSIYEGLQVKSLNGLCAPTYSWVGSRLFGYIEINANPIVGKYGKDVIEICSPTYSLFLNVEITPSISDFVVSCQDELWGDSIPKTYTKNLSLRVTPNTAAIENPKEVWEWSVNGGDHQITTGGSLTINLNTVAAKITEGENQLHLFAQGGTEPIKTYKFNYSEITTDPKTFPKLSLYGCEQGMYTSCNSSTKSALLVADGYVDSDIYSKVSVSLQNTDKGETAEIDKINKNIVTISNIPGGVDNVDYKNKLSLKYGTTEIDSYEVGRDYVSRIVLPGHNILDESDKKGLQKVHVYGNYSYYNETNPEYPGYGTEGLVNYYKVPVRLYDSKRQEIVNDEKHPNIKLKILNNLKITIGRNSRYEIDQSGEFIKIYFHDNDLYTEKEIFDNAFDTKTGNNIDFQVATKSNEVHADYKFVAVHGTNVWDQEPMLKASKYSLKENSMVLQKNFGVSEEKTEYSSPFDNPNIRSIYGVYGNGYLFSWNYFTIKFDYKTSIFVNFFLNSEVSGLNSEHLTENKYWIEYALGKQEKFSYDKLIGYSKIHNFTQGCHVGNSYYEGKQIFAKNSIFFNSLGSGFYSNKFESGDQRIDLNIENCSFFNSASFPITCVGDENIRIKGYFGLYNFKGKEMMRIIGVDLTPLWPVVLAFARANHMVHIDANNNEVINSFMVNALNNNIYFYNFNKGEYVNSKRGIPGSAPYLAKYADIAIEPPFIGRIGADLWGGTNPSYEPGAPGYYDEYDSEGKIKVEFLNKEMNKLVREIKYF